MIAGRMALRRRLSIIAAASVGIAILIAALACYAVVRSQLRGNIDDSLRAQAQAIQQGNVQSLTAKTLPSIPASAGGPAPYAQIYTEAQTYRAGNIALAITKRTRDILAGHEGTYTSDYQVGDNHLREMTFRALLPLANGTQPAAVQLARPLNGVDNVLRDLRLVLFLVLVGGIFVAGLLGRMASRRVLRPLSEVAGTARHIGATDDLTRRLTVHADDEVGSLAHDFNGMLDRLESSREALDESVRAQRQLVADASHELRTPVTSLRTNIEILLQTPDLDAEERSAMLSDVVEQSEELSALVNDLIELARGDQPGAQIDDVSLDRVVAACVDRARRNSPGIEFAATLHPARIDGVPERLERAVNNLLDNAARHSPPGGTVEVTAGPGGVVVRDHGSGVDPADLPYVFDRFYRGTNSRGRQGSGLGLAIVRQVTEQHGGTASVANADDGGAVFTLSLPATPPDETDEPDDHVEHAADTGDSRPFEQIS